MNTSPEPEATAPSSNVIEQAMNLLDRLQRAAELAKRLTQLVAEDEQGATTWIHAVSKVGRELHDATEFFMPVPDRRAVAALRELDTHYDLVRRAAPRERDAPKTSFGVVIDEIEELLR